ncbi:MAG: type II secretion system GspH family protein [Candidatus Omnitrophica bacterium]|nr:type II secretion system GspH family protein [Candidatus Omnitrophota bacterium]
MKKGFSLLEILLGGIIIVVLAGLSMPIIIRQIERARWAEAKTNLQILRNAQLRYSYRSHRQGAYCEDFTYPFECLDVQITPPKYFDYEVHNNQNKLAIAYCRRGCLLLAAGIWIDEAGNFYYTGDVPDWVKD